MLFLVIIWTNLVFAIAFIPSVLSEREIYIYKT
jgi:hypothetical protein